DKRKVGHDGVIVSYRVHVPASYGATPTPLILNFHGLTPKTFPDAGKELSELSKIIPKSDAAGFIVVHPEGLTESDGSASWNAGNCCSSDTTRDDVGFVKDMLDALES